MTDFIYAKNPAPIPHFDAPLIERVPRTSTGELDPFLIFKTWFNEANESQVEANAMSIVSRHGDDLRNRIVYLRYWDEDGFVFFTNLESCKGCDFKETPHSQALFYWPMLWQQIRIGGTIEVIEKSLADAYFKTRKRASQIGAWISKQSQPLSLDEFEDRKRAFEEEFEGKEVTRPPHWSGFRLVPDYFEFWQGADARLHERLVFRRQHQNWLTDCLYP